MIKNQHNNQKKAKSTWAKSLKVIGIIVLIILIVFGGIAGGVSGRFCVWGSDNVIAESIINAIIGMIVGGLSGILIVVRIMYLAELGVNVQIIAENTQINNLSEIERYNDSLENELITEE